MLSQYLFYAIIALLCVAIFVTVTTLFYHFRIASRLRGIEKDIENKALEFDALKKERSSGPSVSGRAAAPVAPVDVRTNAIEAPVQITDTPPDSDETLFEEDSIQIVRNVGGTFETTEKHISGYTAAEPAPGRPDPDYDETKRHAVSEQPLQPGKEEVIRLYSAALNGPDLSHVYHSLGEILKKPVTAIAIDCTGLDAMNTPELEYLEKLHGSLTKQHRALSLINCSAGMKDILSQHPALARLLR